MTIPRRHRARQISLRAILLLALTAVRCSAGWSAGQGSAPLPEESAGVFIGVEKFSHDYSLLDVRYAVNDAVDLAYALSIERNVLPANHVLLLLAGEPVGGSRERFEKLIATGARRQSARQADIYALVKEQSKLVGNGGILILSISTHGYSDGGEHFLLAEDSLLDFGTGVTAAHLLQAMQAGPGATRLLLIDACREQLIKPAWKGSVAGPDRRSAMRTELVEPLFKKSGYAVLSGASEGEYGYAGDGNGLFTRSVINGLYCKKGERVKTLDSLAAVVRSEVSRLSPGSQQHPELKTGGGTDDLVLFNCHHQPDPSYPPPPPAIAKATLQKIVAAHNLLAAGGLDNVEQSFRSYWRAFQELSPAILATLNQGLVARAQQLDEGSQRVESIRLYQQLLDPLIAQYRAIYD